MKRLNDFHIYRIMYNSVKKLNNYDFILYMHKTINIKYLQIFDEVFSQIVRHTINITHCYCRKGIIPYSMMC